jgi:uncharacterized protein YaiE (UPF0345 family)
VQLKANIYFDGKVISHVIFLPNGSRKTVGCIYPGTYKFNTDAPERMDIIAGSCRVKLLGQNDWTVYEAGRSFGVPGKSFFELTVEQGIAEYLCTYE